MAPILFSKGQLLSFDLGRGERWRWAAGQIMRASTTRKGNCGSCPCEASCRVELLPVGKCQTRSLSISWGL